MRSENFTEPTHFRRFGRQYNENTELDDFVWESELVEGYVRPYCDCTDMIDVRPHVFAAQGA